MYIGLENIDLISLDHDLGDTAMAEWHRNVYHNYTLDYNNITEKTGMDCANFLAEYCQKMNVELKQCSVHSHNPVGASNIQNFINGFKKHMGWVEDCFLMKHPFVVETKSKK
jgi:hypothetical protein